jgi:hypothetical protein
MVQIMMVHIVMVRIRMGGDSSGRKRLRLRKESCSSEQTGNTGGLHGWNSFYEMTRKPLL